MVARIISGRNIRGAVSYNERKVEMGRATFIHAVNYLKDSALLKGEEKLFVLQHRAKLNERVKTNCLHISLNFETNEKISLGKMQQIAEDYMGRLGFGNQPYLVYQHKDAAHPHLHIVSTNIDADGKRISLHNLGRGLSEQARQDIELKYGLIQAAGRGKKDQLPILPLSELKRANYGEDETKKIITQIVNAVVAKYNFTSVTELNAVLGRFNILADRGYVKSGMYSKRGLLYRIIDEKGNKLGVPIKASRIDGKHTLTSLEKRFEKNKTTRRILSASLRQRLDQVMKGSCNQKNFEKELGKQQIEVLYRTSKDGRTFGVTYIDHAGKSVFNGSELGKAYSAKALTDGFVQKQQDFDLKPKEELKAKQPRDTYVLPVGKTNYLEVLLGNAERNDAPLIPHKKKKRKKGKKQQIQL